MGSVGASPELVYSNKLCTAGRRAVTYVVNSLFCLCSPLWEQPNSYRDVNTQGYSDVAMKSFHCLFCNALCQTAQLEFSLAHIKHIQKDVECTNTTCTNVCASTHIYTYAFFRTYCSRQTVGCFSFWSSLEHPIVLFPPERLFKYMNVFLYCRRVFFICYS